MDRRTIWILSLGLIVSAACLVTSAALGSPRYISLSSADPLVGQVAQSLAGKDEKGKLPVAGQDFELADIRFYNERTWAVATVKPLNDNADAGTVVLQKKNGFFQVVLGPGTSFSQDYMVSLPSELASQLAQDGVIDVSGN